MVAAQLLVLGAIASYLGGVRSLSWQPKTFAPIDAGLAPRIAIDDPDSRVVVTVAHDGKVHVRDASETRGLILGYESLHPLQVLVVPGGIRIVRTAMQKAGHIDLGVGGDEEITEVAVPAGASVHVERAGDTDLTGWTRRSRT